MTTYFQFVPSNSKAPTFMPTFDGQAYSITIMWNISSQRYFLNCKSIGGTLIFMIPLVESLPSMEISALEWNQNSQAVVLETAEPHGLRIGEMVDINVINCIPATYNGEGLGAVLTKTKIAYRMALDPGQATTFGVLDILISLTKGYFTSTLVYRNKAFEVNP